MNCPSPKLQKWLLEQIPAGSTVLDIGCGTKWYWPALRTKNCIMTGVDAHRPFNPELQIDLEHHDLPLLPQSYDVVLMIDFIEHLTKEIGENVLRQAKAIARDRVLLVTPLEWSDNAAVVEGAGIGPLAEAHVGNTYDYHKSLWSLEDFVGWERFSLWRVPRFVGIWRAL